MPETDTIWLGIAECGCPCAWSSVHPEIIYAVPDNLKVIHLGGAAIAQPGSPTRWVLVEGRPIFDPGTFHRVIPARVIPGQMPGLFITRPDRIDWSAEGCLHPDLDYTVIETWDSPEETT